MEPSMLQDFCASTAAWRNLGMMEEEWGQSTSLQPEEGAPSLPHPAQLFPTQNTTRVQETVGTPEGRKGFWLHFHFVQNAALLTSAGDSPPPARWIVQGTGTKPHKGTTAPAETRSSFCRSSAQRTRAPGLDGILGDEQPHPSHPERKTQREKNLLGASLFSLLPLGSAEKMVKVQQKRSLSCPFSGPPSHPSCRSCSWRGSHWSHLLFGAAASPSPTDGPLEMQGLLWRAQHSPEEPFAAVGDTKKAILVLCSTEGSAGRVYQAPEATRGPG